MEEGELCSLTWRMELRIAKVDNRGDCPLQFSINSSLSQALVLWLPFQLVVLVNLFFTLGTFGARLDEWGPAFL